MDKNIKRVLILGSGALKIGQAGEFDYSGSQAIKALKENNIYTVLINPNIATVQTNKNFADTVYFLPVQVSFVEQVIKKEKIDSILLSFGGQTALNCGLELEKSKILEKYNVRVLGTPVDVIRNTEDRELFVEKLKQINISTARSIAVYDKNQALKAAEKISYPVMLRAGFSLGGMGSKIVNNEQECENIARVILNNSKQILVEECLTGWKEIEYEVVRDNAGNCITVCNMENLDPMGVHTGDSIVIAPSQTLDDCDYNLLRSVAIKTIRHLGIIGECNIQYAYNPKSREYRVIEVNARLSRSSALASKATGYPLAYVAAKIAIGYNLDSIKNSITKTTSAFFEPALDYVAIKIPRWDLDKFAGVDKTLGSEMKSVGEVMAIGRNFPEALQKALRMLDLGYVGLEPEKFTFDNLKEALSKPNQHRLFAIAQSFYKGMKIDEIYNLTKIDRFFLYYISEIVSIYKLIKNIKNIYAIEFDFLYKIKKDGFSDKFLASILCCSENDVREHRKKLNIRPKVSQIDTLAAEYPAQTNFLYYSYDRDASDISSSEITDSVIILGSGCYRIGSSVEFDWCGVAAANTARKLGYKTIVLNCNPETVSTDYDNSDFLIFDEICLEIIDEIYHYSNSLGLIISFGGQTPNNLAIDLNKAGIKILGTSSKNIDKAEDRNKFSALLDNLKISQPKWHAINDYNELDNIDKLLGDYPLLVRPSYVLSGRAMKVAYNKQDLFNFIKNAENISQDYPVIISKFEENAKEIELDAVAYKGNLKVYALSEHVEQAGVHSGDATLVLNPISIPENIQKNIITIAKSLASVLDITGPFNLQLLYKNNELKIIECNLRASRSVPFVSKALDIKFVEIAALGILGSKNILDIDFHELSQKVNYKIVKAPKFSFDRLRGADPKLGVEMLSTGEVACFGKSYLEALLLAYLAVDFKLPEKGILLSVDCFEYNNNKLVEVIDFIINNTNLKIYLTSSSLSYLRNNLKEQLDNIYSNIHISYNHIELLSSQNIDLIISIHSDRDNVESDNSMIRKLAIERDISLLTELNLTLSLLKSSNNKKLSILSYQDFLETRQVKEVQS